MNVMGRYRKSISVTPELRKKLLSDKKSGELAGKFKLLAHPTRLQILRLLAERELCVCVLAELLGKGQPNISQHLSKLKASGMVRDRNIGKWALYSISDQEVKKMLNSI
jgi:DNA-binding transcriptional ArsR family regulator